MTISNVNFLVGNNFRLIREKKKISQEVVADKLDVGTARISDFENGKGNPTLKTIDSFAKAIDVKVIELFDFGNFRNELDISQKEMLIEVHCSALLKRNLKEVQYVFDSTNAFLNFNDKK